MNVVAPSTSASGVPEYPSLMRVSDALRGILSNNPDVESFSVERILSAIGDDGFEASLIMFSIPAIVPIPHPIGVVALPAGAIACEMVAGSRKIRLPRFIRKKSISRRALAVAIHAILPALELAEKVMRPRWSWVNHAIWRRLIGLFLVILVVAIAFPLFGFNSLHATSIFVISLGMAEKDGFAVMVGVLAGVLSLAIVASGVSYRAVGSKVVKWLWKAARRLGLMALARYLDRLGHEWLAKVASLRWSDLLLIWNPEKQAAKRARGAVASPGTAPQPGARGPTPARPYPTAADRLRRARSSSTTTEASLSSALA